MPSFNSVTLVGNVTRDPELRNLSNGGQVADFGLAVNRRWKDRDSGEDREEVCFVDCSAFGKLAEIVGQWVQKGKPLLVDGRLKMDQWQDKQGNKRSKLFVVVEQMQLLGGKPGGENDNGAGRDDDDRQYDSRPSAPPQNRQQQRPQQQQRQRPPLRRNPGGPQDADIPF